MEGRDAFGSPTETTPGDDPFEGTDFGDFDQEPQVDAFASEEEGRETPAATGELKTVDREGNEIAAEANEGEAQAPVDGAPAEGGGSPPPTPADARTPTSPVASDGPTEAGDPPPAGDGTAPPAVESLPTTPGDGEPRPTPAEALAAAPAGSTGPSAGESSSTPERSAPGVEDGEDAAPPEETTDGAGRKTKRRYCLLRQDGPDRFVRLHWWEDKKGNLVQRGAGARRQSYKLARDPGEALKFGFAVCESPASGVVLVAVAALHFQPQPVKLKPLEPSRQRLQIG